MRRIPVLFARIPGAAVAPGVSIIEAGVTGWSIDEANQLLRSVRGLNVIGGDVVCLMPTKDSPNNITAMVAAHMMYEIASLLADAKRQAVK
jgi:guanidinopropionase